MRGRRAAFGAVLLALCASGLAAGEPAPTGGREGRFASSLRASYYPPQDPEQGRLYDAALRALEAGRSLPKAIDLGLDPVRSPVYPVAAVPPDQPAPDGAPEPVDEGGREAGAEAPAQVNDQALGTQSLGTQWQEALDHAVVDRQDLAYVLLRAGEYRRAAALYGELSSLQPDSLHLPAMQALCLWQAGRRKDALDLLKEAGLSEGEAGDWAKWMADVLEMTRDEDRPDAASAPASPAKAGGG